MCVSTCQVEFILRELFFFILLTADDDDYDYNKLVETLRPIQKLTPR